MAEQSLTGMQKVAVLLKSLPAETVEKVLKHMDPAQGKMLSGEMAKIAADPRLADKMAHVLDEAAQMLSDAASVKQAPRPAARPAAKERKNAGPDTLVDIKIDDATSTIADLNIDDAPARPAKGAPGDAVDPLRALAELPVTLLVKALESENARTIFILMENLKIELAGQVYKLLSPAKRKEVSMRFAEKVTLNEHLIKQIAQGVLKKCQALRATAAPADAEEQRQQRMAALLNNLERTERMEMLALLEKTDAGLTERVKNLLYQFEVIARMENVSVQKLLAEVNMQGLAVALKGAAADIEERIMANLSKRAQETLREEISLLGNVTSAKVREARQTVVLAIQQLDQRGEFLLREGNA